MAESEFAKLTPEAGVDRVGAPDDRRGDRRINERNDGRSYFPLNLVSPAEHPPAPEPPPPEPVEPPTEAERREALRVAVEVHKAAQAALEAAQQAHAKAKEHRAACAAELKAFDGLRAEMNAATLDSLRGAEGRPDLSGFAGKIAERVLAEAALAASETACLKLYNEEAEAAAHLEFTTTQQRKALGYVLNFERARLFAEQQALVRRVSAYAQRLRWEDDQGVWQEVSERLLADPLNADLNTGQMPDAPVSEPARPHPVLGYSSNIRLARPIGYDGPDVVLSEAEFALREKQRVLAEQQAGPGNAWEEERARQQARGFSAVPSVVRVENG
jgi:hypothetical protein